jgi:hypothetical protein
MPVTANRTWAAAAANVAALALALSISCAAVLAQTPSKEKRPNGPPAVTLTASTNRLCYGGEVKLVADAKDPDSDKLTYKYSAEYGRLEAQGRKASWRLDEMGFYEVSVEVSDGRWGVASASARVAVYELCLCPTLSVSGSALVLSERPTVRFDLNISGGAPDLEPTYSWSVSAGKIVKGKRTMSILVDAEGVEAEDITATVEVGRLAPECDRTESFTVKNPTRPAP